MSRGAVAAVVASAVAVGCSGPDVRERLGVSRTPIAYGTLDASHTAVAAVLSPVGSSDFQECTGSIVAVARGEGYVLTAAHCCNSFVPTVVVASNDYSVGEATLGGATPVPPVYGVVPGSVYYDAEYDGAGGHDFCLLRFAGADTTIATLALPSSSSDGLQLGSQVQHVGFGITDTTNNNTQRRSATDSVDLQLTNLLIEFSQGGPNQVPGTCEGDSGGPTLLPAGVAQAQQVIVGVQSFGNSSSCTGETLGAASRVTSAIGPGGFITSYLAGTPIGVHAGGSAPAGGPWTRIALAVALVTIGRRRLGPLRARSGTWRVARPTRASRPAPNVQLQTCMYWGGPGHTGPLGRGVSDDGVEQMMTMEDALGTLRALTPDQIRAFMRDRLEPDAADAFDVLTENVSRDVLALVAARALSRLESISRSDRG
jgi:hypothetical protein